MQALTTWVGVQGRAPSCPWTTIVAGGYLYTTGGSTLYTVSTVIAEGQQSLIQECPPAREPLFLVRGEYRVTYMYSCTYLRVDLSINIELLYLSNLCISPTTLARPVGATCQVRSATACTSRYASERVPVWSPAQSPHAGSIPLGSTFSAPETSQA